MDHGFTVGDGVFETLKVVDGTPFAPSRHIRRLRRSASLLGLADLDPELVAAAMADAVAANADQLGDNGRLRVTYTSGEGPLGSDRGDGPGTLLAVATPGAAWPATAAIVTVPWPRNERGPLAGVKSTSYAENAMALAHAKLRGASEGVLANTQGELCEGTGSNVFIVRNGQILTPPLASGCLAGITRELVLEWFDVREETMAIADLETVDEVFLTSSTRDVHPVSRVDDRELQVPQVSGELARQFVERAAADLDP